MTTKLSFLFFWLVPVFLVQAVQFSSNFTNTHDRVWLGEDYWANPMEDWAVRDGKMVCLRNGANRNVHLLTVGLAVDDLKALNAPLDSIDEDAHSAVAAKYHVIRLTRKEGTLGISLSTHNLTNLPHFCAIDID